MSSRGVRIFTSVILIQACRCMSEGHLSTYDYRDSHWNGDVVPKMCSSTKIKTINVIVYEPSRCYRRSGTTTGALWWKKTRYFTRSYPCRIQKYQTQYRRDYILQCCEGYLETPEGLCMKEKVTCNCTSEEKLVYNTTSDTCWCRDLNCTEKEAIAKQEILANCSDGCEYQSMMENCTGVCNCETDDLPKGTIISVPSTENRQTASSSSAGTLAAILIIVIIVIIAVLVLAMIVKRKYKSQKKRNMAISNISYAVVEDSIPANTRESFHYSLAGSCSNGDRTDAEACDVTSCKNLDRTTGKTNVENDYVTVGFTGSNNAIDSACRKQEFAYDEVTFSSPVGNASEIPNDKLQSSNISDYDSPVTLKNSGACNIVSSMSTKQKIQDKPDTSDYDIPPIKHNETSYYDYPKRGANRERPYLQMSFTAKGVDEDTIDNIYVLPSQGNGGSTCHDDEHSNNSGKPKNGYANIAFGNYENVMN